MNDKEVRMKLSEISDNILEVIEGQLSEYQNTDGIDRGMTQSDLQGAIEAQVRIAYMLGKK